MIFCKVDDRLCKEIHNLSKGKLIVDCGCGEGLFEKHMKELFPHQSILSIDIRISDSALINNILHINCLELQVHEGMLPVFIRPCHSNFVSDFIEKNKSKVSQILYIGLKENIAIDLGDLEYTIISDWVGQDGEQIYQIKGERYIEGELMNTYRRVFDRSVAEHCGKNVNEMTLEDKNHESSWYLYSDNKKINRVGGYNFIRETDEVLEEVEAEDFEDLDWTNTFLNNPNEKCGWVSPDGKFYGCKSMDHINCIELVCKLSMSQAEKLGWAHLYYDKTYYCEKQLTIEQARTLSEKGCELATLTLQKLDEGLHLGKDWLQASMKVKNYDGD